jgi:hypothetical protein
MDNKLLAFCSQRCLDNVTLLISQNAKSQEYDRKIVQNQLQPYYNKHSWCIAPPEKYIPGPSMCGRCTSIDSGLRFVPNGRVLSLSYKIHGAAYSGPVPCSVCSLCAVILTRYSLAEQAILQTIILPKSLILMMDSNNFSVQQCAYSLKYQSKCHGQIVISRRTMFLAPDGGGKLVYLMCITEWYHETRVRRWKSPLVQHGLSLWLADDMLDIIGDFLTCHLLADVSPWIPIVGRS